MRGRAQIGQRKRVLIRLCTAERLQRFHRDDPGRNRSGEILGKKGAKRLIFPALNVAGTPIIHQHHAKNMLIRTFYGDRLSQFVALCDKKAHFQLKIHFTAWLEAW